jgi:catechol 2,3-dioxygenase-like lactoylglutathione lyase family enzyme
MTESTFHHVGVLVPDMQAAMRWFEEVLGVSFGEPQDMVTQGRIDPNEYGDNEQHQGNSRLAWARQGPPYIELVEAKGNGLHSLERHGAGPHHVGVFVDDVDEVLAKLEANGRKVAGRVVGPNGATMVCWMEPAEESGLMVEFMNERLREGIQGWIDSGRPPVVAQTIAAG